MAGAGGEGGAGGDTTDDTLSNVSLPCAVSGFTNAVLPDEIDHRYGIVLTPTSYPFTVETVRYSLRHDDQFCDASFAHEVDILRTSTVPPSATPSTSGQLVESHTISASAPLLETVVALSLDAPLELSAGESLVVSIQMVANGAEDRTLCLNTCYDQALTGKDLWSNTAVEPYDWADLVSDYDILANATVSAY